MAIASKIYFMTLYDAPSQANRVLESVTVPLHAVGPLATMFLI